MVINHHNEPTAFWKKSKCEVHLVLVQMVPADPPMTTITGFSRSHPFQVDPRDMLQGVAKRGPHSLLKGAHKETSVSLCLLSSGRLLGPSSLCAQTGWATGRDDLHVSRPPTAARAARGSEAHHKPRGEGEGAKREEAERGDPTWLHPGGNF